MIALLLAVAAPSEPATCVFDTALPAPCMLAFSTRRDGTTVMTATAGGKRAVFVGKRQSGWWSGTLDGRPAMGYELNRGNVTFATRDLARTFQFYTRGNEHGSY